jgi:predicted dinucleotide-binding enzyme
MGGKLGTIFARAGHEVVFSYARTERKLKALGREAKGKAPAPPRAGTPGEAARGSDVLLLAVHWSRVDDVLQQAGDVSGKVIISCSLPMNDDDTDLVIAHTSSGAEALARKVPQARVVSAFGTVPRRLFDVFKARRKATKPSLIYCGDDAKSKKIAAKLIRDVGFGTARRGTVSMASIHRTPSRHSSHSWHMRARRVRSSRIGLSGSRIHRDHGAGAVRFLALKLVIVAAGGHPRI